MAKILQITSKGAQLDKNPEVIAVLQRQFIEQHALVFHQALDPELLSKLHKLLNYSHFVTRKVPDVGDQEVESPAVVARALDFALCNKSLLDWINLITGSTISHHITGGLTRIRVANNHRLVWHDDHLDTPIRQLAVTINLSLAAYEGGVFELRYKGQNKILFRHHHTDSCSLMMFKVDRKLEHRVTAVENGGPRLVYAGWFS